MSLLKSSAQIRDHPSRCHSRVFRQAWRSARRASGFAPTVRSLRISRDALLDLAHHGGAASRRVASARCRAAHQRQISGGSISDLRISGIEAPASRSPPSKVGGSMPGCGRAETVFRITAMRSARAKRLNRRSVPASPPRALGRNSAFDAQQPAPTGLLPAARQRQKACPVSSPDDRPQRAARPAARRRGERSSPRSQTLPQQTKSRHRAWQACTHS